MTTNLSMNSILLSTIQQGNENLLCSEETQILLLENSIQDFYSPECSLTWSIALIASLT